MTGSARVVLVTPNWRWDESPLATDTLSPPCAPPMEWAYLAPGLGGALAGLVDAYAADYSIAATVAAIEKADPQIVVVATAPSLLYWRCPPFSVGAISALLNALRKAAAELVTVLIGPHGTHNPEWTQRVTGADHVWRGSSDVRLAPILSASLHSCRAALTEISSITVDAAEDLPYADYSIFDTRLAYAPHMWLVDETELDAVGAAGHGALAESSRGCPWSCAYCAKGPVRDSYGTRNLSHLAREITTAVSLGFEYLFFIDETFNIPGRHNEQILQMLADSRITFGFQGRPDLITPELARRLADCGCVYAELGIDLLGDELSRDLGRRQRLTAAEQGLAAARKHIPVVRFNRLNATTLDYVSLYGFDATLDWETPADPIYPYPGAPIGRDIMRLYGRANFDWEFGERYSWWLRIEVFLQRRHPDLDKAAVRDLKDAFLSMNEDGARALAELLKGIQEHPNFHTENKAVLGHGGRPHIRDSGSK